MVLHQPWKLTGFGPWKFKSSCHRKKYYNISIIIFNEKIDFLTYWPYDSIILAFITMNNSCQWFDDYARIYNSMIPLPHVFHKVRKKSLHFLSDCNQFYFPLSLDSMYSPAQSYDNLLFTHIYSINCNKDQQLILDKYFNGRIFFFYHISWASFKNVSLVDSFTAPEIFLNFLRKWQFCLFVIFQLGS